MAILTYHCIHSSKSGSCDESKSDNSQSDSSKLSLLHKEFSLP